MVIVLNGVVKEVLGTLDGSYSSEVPKHGLAFRKLAI